MNENKKIINQAVIAFEEATGIPISIESSRNEVDAMLKIKDVFFDGQVKKIGKRTDYSFINEVIERNRKQNFIIILDYLTQKTADIFKENSINFLDVAGNCYINTDRLFVYIEGRKNEFFQKSVRTPLFQEAGLKLILFLISNPESIHYSYRELSGKADVSLGSVSNIFKDLKKEGFLLLTKKERVLKNRKILIDQWVLAYKEMLKPRYFRKKMHPVNEKINLNLHAGLKLYWSGEPGGQLLTGHLQPLKYIVYTNEELAKLSQTLRIFPDENGRIEVYEKFWTDALELEKENIAPPLVVYADLINSGISRNMEAAKLILENDL